MTETRGERKLVTLLFVDLTGYTALADALDPEDVFAFIRPTMTELQRVVEDHGGTVPQIQGDGFMAVFGVPHALEDDAERAVRAALAVRDRVRELNEGRSGIAIPEVHSGVNSGEVMVGPSTEASGIAVVGDVVNTASRLADLAAPGTVLVEERTWRRTRHAIRYGGRRTYVAKGKLHPLAAYEARAPRTALPVGRARPLVGAGFVDREAQLARLADAYRSASADARAHLVVVTAEPGAGKTRLAAEFTRRTPDALVLTGRATSYGSRHAFAPLAAAIGEIAGVEPGSSTAANRRRVQALAERASGPDRRRLARGLSLLLGVGPAAGSHGGAGAADAIGAARAVLEELAADRPVVIVLDDLQWADPAVIDAMRAIPAQPWAGTILFLGLARTEAADRFDAATRIALDAIHEDAMHELAGLALGVDALPPAVRTVARRAGGNPLFLEESLSMLIETGALVSTVDGWRVTDTDALERVPTTVRALVAARLDALPADEKQLLQRASVAGMESRDRLLQAIVPDVDVATVLRALVGRDLLRRTRGRDRRGGRSVAFKHALIRDVAYGSLPKKERARLHVEVATWLEGEADGAATAEALAHHYTAAWRLSASSLGGEAPGALARSAATALGRWADETMASQALRAESIYATALEVGSAAPEAVGPDLRARFLVSRAECQIELGHHRDAQAGATEALGIAEGLGDEPLAARALVTLARVESDIGDDEAAFELIGRALATFDALGDVSGRAWATHRLSEIAGRTDYAAGLDHLREAHALFSTSKDRWGQVIAAQDLAYMLTTVGGDELDHWYRQAERLTEGEGDLRSRAELARTLGYAHYYRGEHAEALAAMRRALPLAIEAGDRYAEADALLITALAAASIDPPRAAVAAADAAIAFGRSIRSTRMQALGRTALARAAVRSGEPRRATTLLASARRSLERAGALAELTEADLAVAEVCLDRGAWARVRVPAARARDAARGNGERLLETAATVLLGRAALGAGSPEAIELLAEAVTSARDAGAAGSLAVARAAHDQAALFAGRRPRARSAPTGTVAGAIATENEGVISFVEGAAEEAAASFADAAARWRELGATAWLARAEAMLGEALRGAGDGRGATAARSRARRVLDRVDAPAGGRDALLHPLPALRA